MPNLHAPSTEHINPLRVNGKAEVVVLDATSYQELLDKVEQTELIESLREAIAEMDAGKGIPLEILKAELDERYGGQSENQDGEQTPTPTR